MTSALHGERARRPALDRRRVSRDVCPPPRAVRPELPEDDHHAPEGVTLDSVLSGAWEALCRHESAACPICGEAVRPRYGSGPQPTGGRCSSCGTVVE